MDQMIIRLEPFMAVSGAFLGETSAIGGIGVGASVWETSQDNQLMNLWLVRGIQKPCNALRWHTERHETVYCMNTQLYMCAQALTHTYWRTSFSLAHKTP